MGQTEEKNISISKGPKKEEKKKQRNKRSNLWLFGYIAFQVHNVLDTFHYKSLDA